MPMQLAVIICVTGLCNWLGALGLKSHIVEPGNEILLSNSYAMSTWVLIRRLIACQFLSIVASFRLQNPTREGYIA